MKELLKNKVMIGLLSAGAVVYVMVLVIGAFSVYGEVTDILRYAGEILCFFMAVVSLHHAHDERDARLLLLALFLTLVADVFLVFLRLFELGIACFCFVHLLYIDRYDKRMRPPFLIALVAVLTFCLVGTVAGLQLPYIFILGVMYATLIFFATDFGFKAKLPRQNALLVKAGMTAFLLCDANVAVNYLLPPGNPFSGITEYLVWIFYLPALAMLALSAYGYKAPGLRHTAVAPQRVLRFKKAYRKA